MKGTLSAVSPMHYSSITVQPTAALSALHTSLALLRRLRVLRNSWLCADRVSVYISTFFILFLPFPPK